VLVDAGASDPRLPDVLAARDDVRAALVVLGDLTFLPGIDPTRDVPDDQHAVSDRRVDPAVLGAALARVESLRASAAYPVVLATAPLGKQGRVEVPELLPVAARVREHPPVLDLAAAFREREDTPMFTDGVDVLDRFGHEAVALAVFALLCAADTPVPARDDDERAARLARRALGAWAADEDWRALAREAVGVEATAPAATAQQAALVGLLDGRPAARKAWGRVRGDTPGRSLANLTLHVDLPASPPDDRVEALLGEAASRAFTTGRSAAQELVTEAVRGHPHRLDAWLVATRASSSREDGMRIASEALASLRRLSPAPVSAPRTREVLADPVDPVPELVALCVLQAPFEGFVPTGPALDRARRAARLGLVEVARSRWERDRQGAPVPPAWDAEVQRLLAAGGG